MRTKSLITLSLMAMAVAACGGTKNRGLESVHQPVVTKTNYVYDVSANAGGEETARLADWMAALKVGYGDRIAVDDGGNSQAREEVAGLAARYGLLIDQVAPITQGQIAPGMVRVVISRSKAEVPGCPDWSRQSQPEFGMHAMSNFGCAANSNLAAMVANPEDLVQGRDTGSAIDGDVSNKAIRTYRTAPPSGVQGLKKETRSGQ
jgi:pilus assembly protein CpaD